MSSRQPTTSRRSSGARRRPAASSDSNSTPILIGVGVLVLAGVGYMVMSSGGTPADAKGSNTPKSSSSAPAESSKSSAPAMASSKPGKPGKTPGRAAPAFSSDMQQECLAKIKAAEAIYNEAITAQGSGDHDVFKSKGKECQEAISQIKSTLGDQLDWQEEALMEGWAQPADYGAFEALWKKISSLDKKARMIGS